MTKAKRTKPSLKNTDTEVRFREELHARRQVLIAKCFVALAEVDHDLRAWKVDLTVSLLPVPAPEFKSRYVRVTR